MIKDTERTDDDPAKDTERADDDPSKAAEIADDDFTKDTERVDMILPRIEMTIPRCFNIFH